LCFWLAAHLLLRAHLFLRGLAHLLHPLGLHVFLVHELSIVSLGTSTELLINELLLSI
jgi:hypothetical protein